MEKRLTMLMVSLFLFIGGALAQTKVNGTVVSQEDNQPVIGASVLIVGTNTGTVTNAQGKFSLTLPAGKDRIRVSYVGMQTQSMVAYDGMTVRLGLDANAIDEIVVTAMGLKKSEKALGYSATTLKADELQAVPVTDVTQSMAGKVAGVQVSATSTDPGAASSIVIRGFSSITGSNEPLWVVDGVPLTNTTYSTTGNSFLGAGSNMINNNDIESMTILKGAAATALYGSRAANGVVVVTTKSGASTRKNFEVNASFGQQYSQVATLPEFQNKFGQGWNGKRTLDENGSWGPEMDGTMRVYGPIVDNAQMLQKFEAVEDNVKDFFATGVQTNADISLAGQSDKTTYYMSYGYTYDDGIMPSHSADTYKRNTLAFRGSHRATDWLAVSGSMNLANTTTRVPAADQGISVFDGIYEMPRNISITDLQDLSNIFNTPAGYYTEYGITNPYWVLANRYEKLDVKKVYGNAKVDINPISDLTLTYRFGFDYSDSDNKSGDPKISVVNPAGGDNRQTGSVGARYYRRYELNNDFLANYTRVFGDFDLNATVGVNVCERFSTTLGASVTDLTIEQGWWDLANGASPTVTEEQWKRRLVGLFGDFQVSWKDQVYLTLTGRNDWSSTLPIDNNHFFYPGITASWLFTELIPKNDILTFGKLRLAWGKTGNDPGVYLTSTSYVAGFANNVYTTATTFPMNNGTNSFKTVATLGSNTLKPEMTKEFEMGLNLQFLNNRIGLDAAYYNRLTDDMIMTLGADPAYGFTNIVTNLGSVRNKGIELLINATPLKTKDWQWDVSVNWAKNWNKVEKLPEELGGEYTLARFSTSNNADVVYMKAVEGEEIGQLWVYKAQRTDDGRVIVGDDGLPILSDELQATGKTTMNKWTGGFSTDIRYKSLTLSAAFDVHFGGWMYSRTKNLMKFTGNGIMTAYNDRNPFVIPNSVQNIGTDEEPNYVENTVVVDCYGNRSKSNSIYGYSIQDWIDNGDNWGGETNLVSKTYMKLRQVSLSYDLPANWIAPLKLQNVRLSFVGSNLITWLPNSNKYIDPDVATYGTGLVGSFGEDYANPTCRKFGFNIAVKF